MTVEITLEDYVRPKIKAIVDKHTDKFQSAMEKQELTEEIMELVMDVAGKRPKGSATDAVNTLVDLLKKTAEPLNDENLGKAMDDLFGSSKRS